MRILVVGSGGREHALAWKLSQEATVFCAPGNPGTLAMNVSVSATDFDALERTCRELAIDLIVVGPEDPLVLGLADHLRNAGFVVYGPGAAGARLEGDKAYSKALMREAGVPTAEFETFDDAAAAKAYARARFDAGFPVVVKATGNAVGKGVIVTSTLDEALGAIDVMLVQRAFGAAGDRIVVEDRLVGREFSLITIVGDHNFVSLPIAQDYKRAYDGDKGPNTGGMGSYSPVEWVPDALVREVELTMVAPLVACLKRHGIQFRGTLFTGVMVVDDRPYCLEYNVRFGDPETQTLMRRLGSGFARALFEAARGDLISSIETLELAAVSVVVAGEKYPASGSKGAPINIEPTSDDVIVFQAGTALVDGVLVTNGGRVACASATSETIEGARRLAYAAAARVRFEGARYRSDIAS